MVVGRMFRAEGSGIALGVSILSEVVHPRNLGTVIAPVSATSASAERSGCRSPGDPTGTAFRDHLRIGSSVTSVDVVVAFCTHRRGREFGNTASTPITLPTR